MWENLGKLWNTAKENYGFLLISVGVVALIVGVAYLSEFLINKHHEMLKKTKRQKLNRMVLIAMLVAVATILMTFKFPLPFLPGFYKLDASELPVIIGAFTLGPVAGVLIQFLKVLLNLFIDGTTTAFVGEFANFLNGCAFVVPAAIFYYAKKTRKTAIFGLCGGTIVAVVSGCFLNAYLLLPTYAESFLNAGKFSTMGESMDELIAAGTAVNSMITDLFSFCVFAVAPFNLLKCAGVSLITILIYKRVSSLLKGQDQYVSSKSKDICVTK